MQTLDLPTEIRSVLREFSTCEAATVNRQGQPITWPTCVGYLAQLFSYDIATQAQGSLPTLMGRDMERPTLFSAFLDELQQSPIPTVVVFEDVHWADEATLDLIKFLGRRIPHLPILFLVTYRDTELSLDHPLWSVIGDLPGNAVARLRLAPLSEQLYAVTGGNPFFVTEVLASDTPGVSLMVRDAVLARIARISSTARTLLVLVCGAKWIKRLVKSIEAQQFSIRV